MRQLTNIQAIKEICNIYNIDLKDLHVEQDKTVKNGDLKFYSHYNTKLKIKGSLLATYSYNDCKLTLMDYSDL